MSTSDKKKVNNKLDSTPQKLTEESNFGHKLDIYCKIMTDSTSHTYGPHATLLRARFDMQDDKHLLYTTSDHRYGRLPNTYSRLPVTVGREG